MSPSVGMNACSIIWRWWRSIALLLRPRQKMRRQKPVDPRRGVLNQIRNKLSFPERRHTGNQSEYLVNANRIGRGTSSSLRVLKPGYNSPADFDHAVRRSAAAISASISTIKHHRARRYEAFQSNHRLPSFFVGFVSWLILGVGFYAARSEWCRQRRPPINRLPTSTMLWQPARRRN